MYAAWLSYMKHALKYITLLNYLLTAINLPHPWIKFSLISIAARAVPPASVDHMQTSFQLDLMKIPITKKRDDNTLHCWMLVQYTLMYTFLLLLPFY